LRGSRVSSRASGPRPAISPAPFLLRGPIVVVVVLYGPGEVVLYGPGEVVLYEPGEVVLYGPGEVVLYGPGEVVLYGPGEVEEHCSLASRVEPEH
jgi:hypothetical protein